jgi:ribulose-phosphate 3-epimerase
MGRLAASILAADFGNLADQMKLVEPHADIFHIDIMDGHFVPPIALGGVVAASVRPITDRVFHAHLMVTTPEGQFDELAEAGIDVASFHLEATGPDPEPVIAKARSVGLGVGLTLNMETPVDRVFPFLDLVDDVMLMSIKPGWSGQQLDPAVFPRVEAVRAEFDRRGLDLGLEVDGGVKIDNARRCVDAGASVLIAASAIFAAADPAEAARSLAEIAKGG